MSDIIDKPDDIPQAIWDQAWGLACDSEAAKVPYYAMGDELTAARKLDALYIARTIMAAKAEERQQCINTVLAFEAIGGKPGAQTVNPYADVRRVVEAIRKRGEG
jgi:hypothetical protein